MRIDVFSHSFMVTELSPKELVATKNFMRGLIQYEPVVNDGRKEMIPARVFASSPEDRRYFRMHINLLKSFQERLVYDGISLRDVVTQTHIFQVPDDARVEHIVKHLYNPRDTQPEIIEYIKDDGDNKVVTLQPGGGKTLIAKHCIADFGVRTAGIMRGSFIDRWVPDLEETFEFKRGELLVIRGSGSLTALMEMALEGDLIAKVIMISINTFTNYLKDYESNNGPTEQYPIPPGIFFEKLGIPFGIFDEAHQFPHQVMKMFSYMHIYKFLSLSATLNTQDKFMNSMYEVMYPRSIRFDGGKFNAFVVAASIRYSLNKPNSIRCKGFQGAYSHTAFEASLMLGKNKKLLENYLALINWCVKENFVDVMEKGQKAIVFCGTINFCTMVQKHLQKLYPRLKVVRYVSKDKMSVMDNADIIVSTVLSAGTAVDIVGLRYNLLTTAIDSQQSNEQTMGRTRVLKDWPGTDVVFHYFVCDGIDKHMRYDQNKREYFRGRVKSHGTVMAPISI